MNRRHFVISAMSIIAANYLFANKLKNFRIKIKGDLDDDLIIIKSSSTNNTIVDIHQMHNLSGQFKYNGNIYEIEHSPGFIDFNKEYLVKENELYCICLANEREDMKIPLTKRIRTHYKSEKLFFNNQVLFPAFMPEYNSIPNYPLWFSENEVPRFNRQDINGDTYNYYNLFENSIVPFGLILPKKGKLKLQLFNQKNELMYTFEEHITQKVKNLKSNELKSNHLSKHPLVELNNIVHKDYNNQQKNEDYIANVVAFYNNEIFRIPLPYPIMYPNQIYAVAS